VVSGEDIPLRDYSTVGIMVLFMYYQAVKSVNHTYWYYLM